MPWAGMLRDSLCCGQGNSKFRWLPAPATNFKRRTRVSARVLFHFPEVTYLLEFE